MKRRLSELDELGFPNELCHAARLLVDARDYYLAFCQAAQQAKRTLFIAGWQLDSEVELLRGIDQETVQHPSPFVAFLNHLCEEKESLSIYILAWDYSSIYALEREWFQGLKIGIKAHKRIHFCYYTHPEPGGSIHQKFVIVDNQTAFVGGMDICDCRYDDQKHSLNNPLRVDVHGRHFEPFHDLQLALSGPVVVRLAEIFTENWRAASSETLLPWWQELPPASMSSFPFDHGLVMSCTHMTVLRTIFRPKQAGSFEIRALLCAAIDAAEQLIYVENQYFTSKDLLLAFRARLMNETRSKLTILLVMPEGTGSLKEDFALGNRQRAVRYALAQLAKQHGHTLRLLKSTQQGPESPVSTFIHSKLMIVDDEFFTCGSANWTNRSMHVDLELNVSFQVGDSACDGDVRDELRRIRASLLAEHAGLPDPNQFEDMNTLVDTIDAACSASASRLDCQALDAAEAQDPLLIALFDPNGPTNLETLEAPFKQAFELDDNFIKNAARKLGQRLGVFDIES